MNPRRVTITQLFLQPRVHRVWMLKHGTLRFDLPASLCSAFDSLWQQYCAAHKPPPTDFMAQEPLVENDALFALFASAVYLDRTLPDFYCEASDDGLHWHFDSTKV